MRLLIAGGGTGGHLYPGIAVAEEVTARGGEVLFVGTTRGIEGRVVPAAGYALELLDVSGLKGMGPVGLVRGLSRLPMALGQSLAILRRFRPDVVLGVGGYASGPMVLAAALARIPTAIQEQNSVPGFTNRQLGRFVRRVFTAFDEAAAFFPVAKVERVGNPVRRQFREAIARASGATAGVLVVGGSQGARAVNDLMIAAAETMSKQAARPPIVHQTGPNDFDRCRDRYRELALTQWIDARPYIEDMAGALAGAALVVGRAGALTLAELAVVGRPALLIPLPTAADDHQTKNAHAFAAAGAAEIVEQTTATGALLAQRIATLMADAERRRTMATAMAAMGRPAAAEMIADRLHDLVAA